MRNYERLTGFKSDQYLVTSLYLSIPPADRMGRPPAYRIRTKTLIQQTEQWLTQQPLSENAAASLREDFARIERHLQTPENTFGENSLPVRGIALFSCAGEGLFEAICMPYVYRNVFVVDRTPYIRRLIGVEHDFGVNLVAAFDHEQAAFYKVDMHGIQELEHFRIKSDRETEKPGSQGVRTPSGFRAMHGVGGHNFEMLRQHETREQLQRVAKSIFEMRKTHPFDRLLIAAPEELASVFQGHLHEYVKRVYAGRIHATLTTPPNTLYEAVLDRLHEIDHEQEQAYVSELENQPLETVAVGLPRTLQMLNWANVRVLLVDQEYHTPGYVFYPSRLLSMTPDEAPEGNEFTWQIPDMVDTMIERAIEQGAEVEIIQSPEARSRVNGVSALLRYGV